MAGKKISEIGARFRTARKRAGLSAADLSRVSGVDAPRISRFERGQKGLELANFAALISSAHDAGVSVEYVLLGEGTELRSDPSLRDGSALDAAVRRALADMALRDIAAVASALTQRSDSSEIEPDDAPRPRAAKE